MLWTKGRLDNGRRCKADANHCLCLPNYLNTKAIIIIPSFDMNILAIKKRPLQIGNTFERYLYCSTRWINFLQSVGECIIQ